MLPAALLSKSHPLAKGGRQRAWPQSEKNYSIGTLPFNSAPQTTNTERDKSMKETLTQSQFVGRFLQIRPDNFSADALCALFDYFEELEQDCGDEMEFDPVAVCCDYSEYPSARDALADMGYDDPTDPDEDEDTREGQALEWLRDNTQAIEFDGGIVVAGF
jgi:hypothetical protein